MYTASTPEINVLAPAIRPLTSSDMGLFMTLCATDPVRFLTPRLNIETYGFEGPVLRGWGAFTPDGSNLRGLMFRLNNTMIVVDTDGGSAVGFAAVMDTELGIAGVRGTAEVVSGVREALVKYRATDWEDSFLMRLSEPPICAKERMQLARRASIQDIEMLSQLYQDAGAMYRSRANVASKLTETRVFVVEEPALGRRPARIASCALLSPEGSDAGLIGGVFTMPSARGKGYAGACVSALAADIQADGKLPVLFYENPAAGALYRKLGFVECGSWAVLYLGCAPERR